MSTKSGRARPLSRTERRSAILDAVVPLLMDRGAAVTTAEMAEAAGVAEGTIFRVFPDKASLLHAAIERTLDPIPVVTALSDIDAASSLTAQLSQATEILGNRFEGMTALIGMLRSIPHDDKPHAEMHRIAAESLAAITDALTGLLEPQRAKLVVEPLQAAVLLRGLVFANGHPTLGTPDRMRPETLVGILLNGITRPGTP